MKKKNILLWTILLLPYIGLIVGWQLYNRQVTKIENSSFVLISKEEMTLSVINFKGENMAKYPIACGENWGNKEERGDRKTPEGVFRVSDIQNASDWSHDFGDGKGKIEGAYGPYFIRLLIPGYTGIGIHGTHNDSSIGTRDTEGCIRLNNADLEKFVKQVKVGDVVVITPSKQDVNTEQP